jgi:hypothetical protein
MSAVLTIKRRAAVAFTRANKTLVGVQSLSNKSRDIEAIACGLFVVAFSDFEHSISDLFFAYAQGQQCLSGQAAIRYVQPKDRSHANSIAKSGQTLLFWSDAGKVIERCGDWFDDGFLLGNAL